MKNKIIAFISIFFILFSAINPLYIFAANSAITKVAANNSSKIMESAKESVPDYVTGQVLVKFKKSKIDFKKSGAANKILSFGKDKKLSTKAIVKDKNIALMKIQSSSSVKDMVKELEKDSNVEYVQPNFIYYPTRTNPDDTYFGNQWALRNIGQSINGENGTSGADVDWNTAMDIFSGSSSGTGSIVAIIDDGVDYTHIDLANKMWDGTNCKDENGNDLGNCEHGYDFYGGDKIPLPTEGNDHGTFVAGIIGAQVDNAKGIVGINPNVKIMAIKVGDESFSTITAIKGINFAKNNGARIINASWGGDMDSNTDLAANEDYMLYQAISDFGNAGGIFVTSAGNDGANHDTPGNAMYPVDFAKDTTFPDGTTLSGLNNIIGVASTDKNDNLSYFSDYGSQSIHVGAPGEDIYSTVNYNVIARENFSYVTPPNLPSGWSTNGGNFGTANYSGNIVLWGDTNQYPYTSDLTGMVITPTYDLSGYNYGRMFYSIGCDTEYDTTNRTDYFTIYISNGGDYYPMQSYDETVIDSDGDSSGIAIGNSYLNITGTNLTSQVSFLFLWHANSTDNNYAGCYIDNMKILGYGGTAGYDYGDGTSFAAPYVAGLTALAWGLSPNSDYSTIKNAVINNGDDLSGLSGKTASGKRINAYKTLFALAAANDNTPPSIPAVISPLSGETINQSGSGTINLSWNDSVDAGIGMSGYNIELRHTSGGSTNTYTYNTTLTGLTIDWSFIDGNNFWKIRAQDQAGNLSDYTDEMQFTVSGTTIVDTTPPSIPAVISPLSGETINQSGSGTINLSWNASVDTGVGMSGYNITLRHTSGGSTNTYTYNTTLTGLSIPRSFTDGNNFWKIRAQDATGNLSDYTDEMQFTVSGTTIVDTTAPSIPVVISPLSGNTIALQGTGLIALSWNASVDTGVGMSGYNITLRHTSGGVTNTYTYNTSLTGLSIPRSFTDGNNFWKIRAQDATGNLSDYTDEMQFTVTGATIIDTTAPSVPVVISPLSGNTIALQGTGLIALSWNASVDTGVGMSGYNITLRHTSGGSTNTYTYNTTLTNLSIPRSFTDGNNFWKIRAQDATGNLSDYTDEMQFTVSGTTIVDTTAPSVPVVISPLSGSTIALQGTGLIALSWNASVDTGVGMSGYNITLRHTSGGSTNTYTYNTTLTNLSIPRSFTDGNNFWKIRAQDATGNLSDYTDEMQFTVSGGISSNGGIIFLSGKYTNNSSTSVKVYSSGYNFFTMSGSGIEGILTGTFVGSGVYDVSLSTGNGQKNVSIQFSSGSTYSDIYTGSIILDTVGPTISVTNYSSGQNVTGNITLIGVFNDTYSITGFNILHNWTSINHTYSFGGYGLEYTPAGSISDSGDGYSYAATGNGTSVVSSWTKNLTLSCGKNTITITGQDYAGNPASTSLDIYRNGLLSSSYATPIDGNTVTMHIYFDIPVAGYSIQYGTDASNLTGIIGGGSSSYFTGISVTLGSLSANTRYYYKIQATDCGDSPISNLMTFTTPKTINISELTGTIITTGSVIFTGITSTGAIFNTTGTLDLNSETGANNITLNASGLTITASGGNWDGIILAPYLMPTTGSIVISGYSRIDDLTYGIGNPDVELFFSGQVANVSLDVGSSYNGQTLYVYRSGDGGLTYSSIGSCLVSLGICKFTTDRFSVFTLLQSTDDVPDQFTFVDQGSLDLNTTVTSNQITISGITTGVTATVSGGEYKVNNGYRVTTNTTVYSGDQITLRGTTSSNYSTTVNVVFNAGSVFDTFSITTKSGGSSSGGGSTIGGGGSYYPSRLSGDDDDDSDDDDENNNENPDSGDDDQGDDDSDISQSEKDLLEEAQSLNKIPLEVVINGITYYINVPVFKDDGYNDKMQKISLQVSEYLKKKKFADTKTKEAIDKYNDFLGMLKLSKDRGNDDAKDFAKKYLNEFVQILKSSNSGDSNTNPSDGSRDDSKNPSTGNDYNSEISKALIFMYDNGLTKYYTLNYYRPYEKITREQAAKMLVGFAKNVLGKKPDLSKTCYFSDISNADPSLKSYITESCQLGIFKGTGGKFYPFAPMTKAEISAVLVRTLYGSMNESGNYWFANYATKAKIMGITNETNISNFLKPLTRYEIALMIYRASQFADSSNYISSSSSNSTSSSTASSSTSDSGISTSQSVESSEDSQTESEFDSLIENLFK